MGYFDHDEVLALAIVLDGQHIVPITDPHGEVVASTDGLGCGWTIASSGGCAGRPGSSRPQHTRGTSSTAMVPCAPRSGSANRSPTTRTAAAITGMWCSLRTRTGSTVDRGGRGVCDPSHPVQLPLSSAEGAGCQRAQHRLGCEAGARPARASAPVRCRPFFFFRWRTAQAGQLVERDHRRAHRVGGHRSADESSPGHGNTRGRSGTASYA